MDSFQVARLIVFVQTDVDRDVAIQRLIALAKSARREHELGPIVWQSKGMCCVIVQEVTRLYKYLMSPELLTSALTSALRLLELLSHMASHDQTCAELIQTNVPQLLYPFLNEGHPLNWLRLEALEFLVNMLRSGCVDNGHLLVTSELIPLVLQIMVNGADESSTVLAARVLKLGLLSQQGLNFICDSAERFYAVARTLENSTSLSLMQAPSARVLKEVLACYRRLADHPRARRVLTQCLPTCLCTEPLPEPICRTLAETLPRSQLRELQTMLGLAPPR